LDEIIEMIRRSVADEHQTPPYAVILIRAGTIPKTSSGKIRRRACRAEFLNEGFAAVAEWREAAQWEADVSYGGNTVPADLDATEQWLRLRLSTRLGLAVESVDVNQSIAGYGLDSLGAMELMHAIETELGVSMPLAAFFEVSTLGELAR